MNPISVLLVVHNEEGLIGDALNLLKPYVDEFVVIDQESTDRTVEIARQFTDKIYLFPRVYYQMAYIHEAALMARNEWVLKCDPDERWDKTLLIMLSLLIVKPYDVFRFRMLCDGDDRTFCQRLWRKSKVIWTDSFDPLIYNSDKLRILDVPEGKIENLHSRASAIDRYRREGARRLIERYGDTNVEPYKNYVKYYKEIIGGKSV